MRIEGRVGEGPGSYAGKESFRISAWVSPVLLCDGKPTVTEDMYRSVRESGLTHIYALYENGNTEATCNAIRAAAKYGVRYYVRDTSIKLKNPKKGDLLRLQSVRAYKDLDGWYGHLANDEPSRKMFETMKALKDVYNEDFPGKDFFVNLLPTYATSEQLGTDTYEEYIDEFIRIMKPDYVSLDHYAMMKDGENGKPYLTDDVLYNYEVVSDRCRKAGIPMFTFIADISYNKVSRTPTRSEIRWQLFSQLAYGSRGIQYFCYWTPLEDNPVNDWSDAMYTRDGRRTVQFGYARECNDFLRLINDVYMSFRHVGTMLISGTNSNDTNPAFRKCRNSVDEVSVIRSVVSDEDVIIGVFKNEEDEIALLIMNYTDPYLSKKAHFSIEFNVANRVSFYYNKIQKFKDLDGNAFDCVIESGEGMFLVPFHR